MGTVIQDMPQINPDRQPRWDRFERAELFEQYRVWRDQGLSERQAAKELKVPRSTLRVLPTGMLDFSFCIRYIRPLISTDVVALDGGGHHDVSTAQSSQNPAGPLPEPTTGEGVA
jgi:hypothetical protein